MASGLGGTSSYDQTTGQLTTALTVGGVNYSDVNSALNAVGAQAGAGWTVTTDASGTGERVAREIGWPYWMSDVVGEDANDYAQRAGVFALAMGIKKAMAQRMRA